MPEHDFIINTQWSGGRDEVGRAQGNVINEEISIPGSLGGQGVGTNPDEMLVAAASSCYIISLAAALERARFTSVSINQQSIGTASLNNGKFKMERITHKPQITVNRTEKEQLEKRLNSLLKIADNNCMISNSIRGNVEIKIEPTIL
ncbi:SACOL1771 family peroxiredoxin [Staphylococcus carnosus]|uniref:Peroxiredoxin n=2 Tax=Staphylococcus carnosus TaxID=1281 RepID=B9DN81_STACT|nr:SACOL1771 family peroxiredoxin [Staphylococcus carnosus]KKB26035.1 peroxiredoxin [Staphylococcus carnosus]KOR13418.1 peroxiredoxin [Staphylococcus carnosus]PNZ97536.1 peroxiredoxin [Staphylococcus carnosus]QPT04350.1 SACOL1771 family peroxiredoxin [Staphylococcus carnosus]QQS85000.1 SACOL1771 family peroxiredoxin [Staphylococcus carnosus]